MDTQADRTAAASSLPSQSTIDHANVQAILSSLSQELCRPLVSLRAGFDLLLGDSARPISQQQRGQVQSMAGLCDDLLKLTRDYLDYAGLLKGTRPLCYGSFTISALIREVDRQFAPLAANRRIDWACSIDKPDTTVSTDASRCQQIFGHLVANALKYTPEGGQIQINGRREGDDWVVIVADNGPGIPQGELDRVFEPFYRLACDENAKIEERASAWPSAAR